MTTNLTNFRNAVNNIEPTDRQRDKINKINSKNSWALNYNEALLLIKKHEKAFKSNKPNQAMLIEYQLTDINVHSLVVFLTKADYKGAVAWVENEFND